MNPRQVTKAEKMRLEYAAARDLFIELGLPPQTATWLRALIWRQFHGIGDMTCLVLPGMTLPRTLALLVYFDRREPKRSLKSRRAIKHILTRLAKTTQPTPDDVLVAWDKLDSLGLSHDEDGNPRGLAEVWARWL